MDLGDKTEDIESSKMIQNPTIDDHNLQKYFFKSKRLHYGVIRTQNT